MRTKRGKYDHRQFNARDATEAERFGRSFDRAWPSHKRKNPRNNGVQRWWATVSVVGPHPDLYVGALLGLGGRPPERAAEQHVRGGCPDQPPKPSAQGRARPDDHGARAVGSAGADRRQADRTVAAAY